MSFRQVINPIMKNKVMSDAKAIPALETGLSSFACCPLTVEVDDEWFDILGVISRHQEGFVWVNVEEEANA